MLLRLLPLLAVIVALWWAATAQSRLRRRMRRTARLLDDWTILSKVRAFAQALGTPGFEVRVLDMDEINGLALPDGMLFISRGLYERYLAGEISADAVAGVIAHEIGHVALGHHKRRLRSWWAQTAAVVAALAMPLTRVLIWILAALTAFGMRVLRNRLSQRDEYEADAFGAQLMMRSDLDPNAMIELLDRLQKESRGRDMEPAWLTGHPPIPHRIGYLRKVIAASA